MGVLSLATRTALGPVCEPPLLSPKSAASTPHYCSSAAGSNRAGSARYRRYLGQLAAGYMTAAGAAAAMPVPVAEPSGRWWAKDDIFWQKVPSVWVDTCRVASKPFHQSFLLR
jgi:hypothetical protein